MATPAKRALDFDQLEQKSRTDTISEAIKEVELTPVDDTKVNNTAEETCKKSPVNKGPKSKKLPTPTTTSTKAATCSSGSSSSRRPATAPTRSSSLTSKISNGPIKTSEVKKPVVNLSSTSASKDAMTKSTSSSDSSSSTVVNTFFLKFDNT